MPEPNSGCWLWTGCLGSHGYGHIARNGMSRTAHRESYELYVGAIPEGQCVCHKCDVPSCVNPDHLFLGDQKKNIADMVSKNRGNWASGSSNGLSKLTEDDIPAIRVDSRKLKDVAADYGVSLSVISRIKRKETWSHV